MKERKSFVANSSSSSFICEVCGHQTDAYHDHCPNDHDMTYCVNGHILCNEHLLGELTEAEEEAQDDDYEYSSTEVPERICPICQFQVLSQPAIVPYLLETRGIPKSEVFAVVKEMNRRRKKLYDYEYINYVKEKFDLNEEMILEELRSKYPTYSDFENRNNQAEDD